MTYTIVQANDALLQLMSGSYNDNDLLNLVKQLSIDPAAGYSFGDTTVLYSGKLLDSSGKIVSSGTEIARAMADDASF